MPKRISYEELTGSPIVVTQELIKAYADASGDTNRIHLDPEFAQGTSFGRIIAHGMMTLSLIDQMMIKQFGTAWSNKGILKSKFRGAAGVGDRIASSATLKSEKQLEGFLRLTFDVAVRNLDTHNLLVGGTCSLDVPNLEKVLL
tara:strand:- start:24485 stop:24916 length:432 start_codon:yes stop_codon:yes gene_type:complete